MHNIIGTYPQTNILLLSSYVRAVRYYRLRDYMHSVVILIYCKASRKFLQNILQFVRSERSEFINTLAREAGTVICSLENKNSGLYYYRVRKYKRNLLSLVGHPRSRLPLDPVSRLAYTGRPRNISNRSFSPPHSSCVELQYVYCFEYFSISTICPNHLDLFSLILSTVDARLHVCIPPVMQGRPQGREAKGATLPSGILNCIYFYNAFIFCILIV